MTRRPITARLLTTALAIAIALLPAPSLRAAQVISPTGVPLAVDVSKGLIIRLDRPCASVFVADPDIADVQLKSPTVLYVLGKAAGETTIYAVDQQDAVLLNSRIEVRQDVDRLKREIQAIDPHGKVRATAVDDSIVLEGSITSAAEGDDIRKIAARYVAGPAELVNKLKLDAPDQVDLQVRVAEVQRNVLKQFGINWETAASAGSSVFGIVSASPALIGGLSATANAQGDPINGNLGTLGNQVVPLTQGQRFPSTLPTNAVGFNAPSSTLIGNAANNSIFVGGKGANALINALAQNGLITILAEPNLVTVSGQKASFLAGGEFPVPVPQSGSGSTATIAIDWKKFGVSLNFTPTILADGRIALHVAPEVSELAPNQGITIQGVTVPGITTRRADTTVELGSGQSFAIAGLLQNQTQQQLQAYPWIGDIPVIGALFRSTAFQRGETELVILVTPYLVQPVSSATALKTDNDGFYAPTDSQRLSDGNENTVPKADNPAARKSSAAGATTQAADATPAAAPRMPVSTPVAIPAPAAPVMVQANAAAITPPAPLPLPQPKAAIALPPRSPSAAPGFEID
ncbi:MAG TPA: type II and III secretion system protein family protein [Stellaceae bacterium]|nr:type II and III secretion system protein family protein [Stellaceae bacterium]